MKNIYLCLAAMLSVMLLSPVCFAEEEPALIYEVRVPFEEGKTAEASLPDGRVFPLGEVVRLPIKTRWPSYTASAWGKPGSITASAVNALHILISVENEKGRTMSIVPRETIAPAAGTDAALVIDYPAGAGFFGAWAPPVGTRVMVLEPDGTVRGLEKGRLPERGDVLLFRVCNDDIPYMIDFENSPGGRVTAWSKSGASLIARVIRPVLGVGRFEGTLYQEPGRIRASHSGVVDVSTSPHGLIGGFQIIPWDHALRSKEMQGAWNLTQWMIIGAPDGKSMLGGTYPLFAGGLVPGPASGETLWDIWSTYGRKPLVMVRLGGGAWVKTPVAGGKADDALAGVTHIRIYFPTTQEPLT